MTTTHYSARQVVVCRMPFQCALCGFSSAAEVAARGAGRATSAGLRHDEQRALAARKQAEKSALKLARLYLELSECPACQRRNPEALARFQRRMKRARLLGVGVLLLGIAVAAAGATWFGIAAVGTWLGVAAALAAAVTVVAVPLFGRQTIANSSKQVRFLRANAA